MKERAQSWLAANDWTMYGIIVSIFLVWRIGVEGGWSTACWVLLLICLLGVRKDQIDVDWKRFFVFGLPLLGIFYYFYGSGNGIWWKIANWMFENNRHPWNWDQMMNSIPFNDGAWARAFHRVKLDHLMVWVYNYGFVLSLWICIVRSFWTKSIKKMLSYALSGHLMQFPLILPFYNLILLREVWWVKGQPDLLGRTFATENDLLVNVMNCFPSMHTSISFAMLLLALREKDRIFKYMMVAYCASIIFSTMYLQIHWVLDVIAGMAFAYGIVKLADLVIRLGTKWMPASIKSFYSGKQDKSYNKETMAA
ncbi:phosphatase PAP2 family protein [Paenibacillus vulneris]|uniref:Phosphatase PAP2 family protein n=1 Tax=Paenibacillus vulneris TaxID=1133364 RepID=A0ABW3UCW8_9BACL|nr:MULTISPECIES: phosphatase PAP2 family protein [unclassified Paenibacillus]MBE1445970.1 membrane-associated phospholipid phosphatase [Paenibacillus sp. OAS669]